MTALDRMAAAVAHGYGDIQTRTWADDLQAELDRLPKHPRARFVPAKRLEAILERHAPDQTGRLVADLARATGRPEAVVRLSAGLGGHTDTAGGGFSRESAVSGDDRGQSGHERPSASETGERP